MPTIKFPPAPVGAHCHVRRTVLLEAAFRRSLDECRCFPLEWMLGRTPFYVPRVPR